jgi:hypothetical protein
VCSNLVPWPPVYPSYLPRSCTTGSMGPARPCTSGPNTVSPLALSFTGCSGLSKMLVMRPEASRQKKAMPRDTVAPLPGSTRRLHSALPTERGVEFQKRGVNCNAAAVKDAVECLGPQLTAVWFRRVLIHRHIRRITLTRLTSK